MKIQNITKTALMVIPTFFCCNCATIFSGGRPNDVSLVSTPSGANVVITKESGEEVYRGVTPATTTLKRSKGYFSAQNYVAKFSKKGYPTQTVALTPSMNPWYAGNILFGGLIGLLIVDPATGAMWTLEKEYVVNLGATASNERETKLMVYERSSIPKEWESHLVAVR